MARSHGRLNVEVWDAGSEFRDLTLHAQWAYVMLLSQPQINNCGVVPHLPAKWARFAAGLDRATLTAAIGDLRQRLFVIVDDATAELLVRTFLRHDGIWKQPNLVTAARREWRAIDSQLLRDILVHRHPWLLTRDLPAKVRKFEEQTPVTGPLPDELLKGVREGLPEGVQLDLMEGVPEGVRFAPSRARDAHAHAGPRPLPQPPPLPPVTEDPELYVAREGQPEPSLDDDHEPAANSTGLAIPTDVLRNIP